MQTEIFDEALAISETDTSHPISLAQHEALQEPDHKTGKLFIVVHMYGSHWPYPDRYPKSYARFPVKPSFFYPTTKEDLDNSYDNSILYSDKTLASVINVVARQNCVSSVLFLPDHGENLVDDGRNLRLHTMPTEQTIHVPMFVWGSPAYQKKYPKRWSALQAHQAAPVGGADIFPTLLGLAGIPNDASRADRDLTSQGYRPHVRHVQGLGAHKDLDYDKRDSWPYNYSDF